MLDKYDLRLSHYAKVAVEDRLPEKDSLQGRSSLGSRLMVERERAVLAQAESVNVLRLRLSKPLVR